MPPFLSGSVSNLPNTFSKRSAGIPDDDAAGRLDPADETCRLEPVEHGHRQVHQNQVGALFHHGFHGLAPVGDLNHPVPELGQLHPQQLAYVLRVVYHHDRRDCFCRFNGLPPHCYFVTLGLRPRRILRRVPWP
jgi:hypothetical protein